MKRILLLSIAMLMGIASFAQKKGDMYVSGFFSADLGGYTMSSKEDGYAPSGWNAFESSFEIGGEYAYFVADNFRLALAISLPFSSTPPSEEIGGELIKQNTFAFDICPNVSYYVKLADKLYYTPTLGMFFQRENINTTGSDLYASKLHTSTWGGYINILEFEFKVSEKFSIGANAGGLGVYSTNYAYSADEKYRMNQFVCDFTHGGVDFKFYF